MVRARNRGIGDVLSRVVIVVASIWVIFPFYWALMMSFKQPVDAFKLAFIPFLQFQPTLDHWINELGPQGRGPEMLRAIRTSLTLGVGGAFIAVALGTPAGYALARFRFRRWSNANMASWFLSQRFLPPVATVVPIYLMMRTANLLDNPLALVICNATFTLPFAVLITRDFFRELPSELEDSALVDGCSRFGAFWRVALPLAAPAVVAAGIICFAFAWNEFLFALVLTQQNVPMTIIIAGSEHTKGVQFWFVATRLLLAILPPAILALLVQRWIVRGLTFGAVKG